MIICHEKRLIFIKTKKTAGTSFEIALSKFCGKNCVITPITPVDEELRRSFGFRTAQNFILSISNSRGDNTTIKLYNHIPAAAVRSIVSPAIWRNYRKITIVRNPFDCAISRYYWVGGPRTGLSFIDYIRKFSEHLNENSEIAPLDGDCQLDCYLRYEDFQNGIHQSGLGYLWDTLCTIRAKGNVRPKIGASLEEIYFRYPEAISIVESCCKKEIDKFGYNLPSRVQSDFHRSF